MADIESVRVFQGIVDNLTARDRTDAQRHTDHALDLADQTAGQAAADFEASLDWARSIGVEIPARVRGVETILRQWQTHLADERKRRG